MTDRSAIGGLSNLVNRSNVNPQIAGNLRKIESDMMSGQGSSEKTTNKIIQDELANIASRLGVEPAQFSVNSTTPKNDTVSIQQPDYQPPQSYQPSQSYQPTQQYEGEQTDEYTTGEEEADYDYEPQQYQTEEQYRRGQIANMMGGMAPYQEQGFEDERKEDARNSMLEQIDFFRGVLEAEEVDLSHLPTVTHKSSFTEIENTLKILKFKYDRVRFSTLADEILMLGAYGLEELFDGERVWFNKYRPDLTGWHKNLRVKLRRMKHNTSTIVGQFVQDYNIGPVLSTLIEIIPNMVHHSFENNRKRSKSVQSRTSEDIDAATEQIRDMSAKSHM